MNRNNAVGRKFARLLAPLAILFVSVFQCPAQSQDQAGTDRKATGQDKSIDCWYSASDIYLFDIYVDVEVKDRRGNGVPSLSRKNFVVYEDDVRQDILSLRRTDGPSGGKYSLHYKPTNSMFDGKMRKVRIEARTSDGSKLRVGRRLRPEPIYEPGFKVGVYSQGYSIQGLSH
jgi:hypothetical protein